MKVWRTTEVVRATGVSYRQLDYWDRIGFLVPSIAPGDGSGQARLYSDGDVEQVHAVRKLLDLGVSLDTIRRHGVAEVQERLREFAGEGA